MDDHTQWFARRLREIWNILQCITQSVYGCKFYMIEPNETFVNKWYACYRAEFEMQMTRMNDKWTFNVKLTL